MDDVEILPAGKSSSEHRQAHSAHGSKKKMPKWVGASIVALLVVVALFLVFRNIEPSKDNTLELTLNDLHALNYEGKLDEERGYVFEEHSFVRKDNLWWTVTIVNDHPTHIPLHYGPRDVVNVSVLGSITTEFDKGQAIYMAIDPEYTNKHYTLGLMELNNNIVKGFGRKPVGSCSRNHTICTDYPVVSCNNTQGKPVIELRPSGIAQVELDGSCILLSGEGEEMALAATRLIYLWYDIMPIKAERNHSVFVPFG